MPRPLVWDEKEQRYVRPTGKRNPCKGLVGHMSRKRSWAQDNCPYKERPRRQGLTSGEKRRAKKGGSPVGGPGKKGAGANGRSVQRQKKGYLVKW